MVLLLRVAGRMVFFAGMVSWGWNLSGDYVQWKLLTSPRQCQRNALILDERRGAAFVYVTAVELQGGCDSGACT